MSQVSKEFVFTIIMIFCVISFSLSANRTEATQADEKNISEQNKVDAKQESAEQSNKAAKAPSVFFPAPKFEFDKMVEGEELLHDFVIMNRGRDVLQVQKVKTTCGCTTVSYSREIPPGGEGKISMKVNTRGYGGRRLTKTVAVMTNDTVTPESLLSVTGNIEKFATITPPFMRLNGRTGEAIKSVVKIIPESKNPFSIIRVDAQDGKNIKYELKEERSASGVKEYSITVENVKKDVGSYYDVLILHTDSKIQPEIKINLMARVIDPNGQSKVPLTGESENPLAPPGSGRRDKSSQTTSNGAGKENNVGNGKNFLEVIQKIEQQNAAGVDKNSAAVKSPSPVQNPEREQELKKKFEALIKQAQEKQRVQEQQRAEVKQKKE